MLFIVVISLFVPVVASSCFNQEQASCENFFCSIQTSGTRCVWSTTNNRCECDCGPCSFYSPDSIDKCDSNSCGDQSCTDSSYKTFDNGYAGEGECPNVKNCPYFFSGPRDEISGYCKRYSDVVIGTCIVNHQRVSRCLTVMETDSSDCSEFWVPTTAGRLADEIIFESGCHAHQCQRPDVCQKDAIIPPYPFSSDAFCFINDIVDNCFCFNAMCQPLPTTMVPTPFPYNTPFPTSPTPPPPPTPPPLTPPPPTPPPPTPPPPTPPSPIPPPPTPPPPTPPPPTPPLPTPPPPTPSSSTAQEPSTNADVITTSTLSTDAGTGTLTTMSSTADDSMATASPTIADVTSAPTFAGDSGNLMMMDPAPSPSGPATVDYMIPLIAGLGGLVLCLMCCFLLFFVHSRRRQNELARTTMKLAVQLQSRDGDGDGGSRSRSNSRGNRSRSNSRSHSRPRSRRRSMKVGHNYQHSQYGTVAGSEYGYMAASLNTLESDTEYGRLNQFNAAAGGPLRRPTDDYKPWGGTVMMMGQQLPQSNQSVELSAPPTNTNYGNANYANLAPSGLGPNTNNDSAYATLNRPTYSPMPGGTFEMEANSNNGYVELPFHNKMDLE